MSSAFDNFYASPSPSRAVALAIADHKAQPSSIPLFIRHLERAFDQSCVHGLMLATLIALRDGRAGGEPALNPMFQSLVEQTIRTVEGG